MCSSHHSNSWRQQHFIGGHNSEVGNVDHHVAHTNQRDPNEDGQRQVPEDMSQKSPLKQETCCIL